LENSIKNKKSRFPWVSSEILASQSSMVIDFFFPPQLTRKNSTGSMVVFNPEEPDQPEKLQSGK
jgi:hypothetical protein